MELLITGLGVKDLSWMIWEFPKIGIPYFGGPYNKDPTI